MSKEHVEQNYENLVESSITLGIQVHKDSVIGGIKSVLKRELKLFYTTKELATIATNDQAS